jgi:hypothetical protein
MGGKVFSNSVPIEGEKAIALTQDVIHLFPVGVDYTLIGSSAYLEIKSTYNDLDFAIVANDSEWSFLKETLEHKGIHYKNLNKNCISIAMPRTSDTVYQVDVMRSKDILFTRHAYFSDPTSKYKGAHRNILLNSIINVLTTEIHGNIRMKYYMDMYQGLSFLVQTKTENSQRYKTIKSLCVCNPKLGYTESVRTIIPNITSLDLTSFEYLFGFVAEHLPYSNHVFAECKKIIETTDLIMPEELQELV